MKVGDIVRRIKEYQLGTWNYDHPGREDHAYTVIRVSVTGATVYLNDSIPEGWAMRYFEPADKEMFNELIDLYYENNP